MVLTLIEGLTCGSSHRLNSKRLQMFSPLNLFLFIVKETNCV